MGPGLFSPDDKPHLRSMVCDLGLQWGRACLARMTTLVAADIDFQDSCFNGAGLV